eukprot:g4499.t1
MVKVKHAVNLPSWMKPHNIVKKKRRHGPKAITCPYCGLTDCNHCFCQGWSRCSHKQGEPCQKARYRSRRVCNPCEKAKLKERDRCRRLGYEFKKPNYRKIFAYAQPPKPSKKKPRRKKNSKKGANDADDGEVHGVFSIPPQIIEPFHDTTMNNFMISQDPWHNNNVEHRQLVRTRTLSNDSIVSIPSRLAKSNRSFSSGSSSSLEHLNLLHQMRKLSSDSSSLLCSTIFSYSERRTTPSDSDRLSIQQKNSRKPSSLSSRSVRSISTGSEDEETIALLLGIRNDSRTFVRTTDTATTTRTTLATNSTETIAPPAPITLDSSFPGRNVSTEVKRCLSMYHKQLEKAQTLSLDAKSAFDKAKQFYTRAKSEMEMYSQLNVVSREPKWNGYSQGEGRPPTLPCKFSSKLQENHASVILSPVAQNASKNLSVTTSTRVGKEENKGNVTIGTQGMIERV